MGKLLNSTNLLIENVVIEEGACGNKLGDRNKKYRLRKIIAAATGWSWLFGCKALK